MNSKVPIGPSSVLGWLMTAALWVVSVALSIEHSEALVSGPSKWPAILGVVTAAATGAGRSFQAAHLNKAASIAGEIGEVPAVLATLAREAQANVAKVAASPDGVDSAAVPFSGATAGGQSP